MWHLFVRFRKLIQQNVVVQALCVQRPFLSQDNGGQSNSIDDRLILFGSKLRSSFATLNQNLKQMGILKRQQALIKSLFSLFWLSACLGMICQH